MKHISEMKLVAAILACASISAPLEAHEFWIDTDLSQFPTHHQVSADIRVGENLSGSALPYLNTTIRDMRHLSPKTSRVVEARLGDRPAIKNVALRENGLHVLTVETNPSYIVFDDIPEFEAYLDYEGLSDIADEHLMRGLPETEIAEEYIRNARALIQLGPVQSDDVDQSSGLPFEIIVDGTPFADDLENLKVRLTWQGRVVPDAQITMFYAPSGSLAPEGTERTLARTDSTGFATFRMRGSGKYMLNAVKMTPVRGPGSVVWQSHWASLTFHIE